MIWIVVSILTICLGVDLFCECCRMSLLWFLLTLSKYFTNPKSVFTFNLISSSVESSITKKKTLAKIPCFLLSCSHFESELWRTPFHQRLMRLLFPDCTVPAGTADKIELCLRYLGQDTGTLPWTLLPVSQVPLYNRFQLLSLISENVNRITRPIKLWVFG